MKTISKRMYFAVIVASLFVTISVYAASSMNQYSDQENVGLVNTLTPTDPPNQDIGVGAMLPILVTEDVDLSYCGSEGAQCNNHTYYPANDSNHNPVRVGIMITANGVGVPGLKASNFTFVNPFIPAGASSAGICAAAICGTANFQDAGNGQYTLFVHPMTPNVNWKAGHYFASLTVNKGKATVSSFVSWEIKK